MSTEASATTTASIPPAGVAPNAAARAAARLLDFGRAPRVMGIDVARGLAVFGMIGAHVGTTAPLRWGDPATWLHLVNGRSAILFALVAGASLALMSGGTARPTGERLRSVRLRMAGRALAVLAIGLALELLGTTIIVILSVYGVLFLVMIPFIGMRRRTLLITAGAIALGGPALVGVLLALALGTTGPGVQFLLAGTYPLTTWMPLMLAGIALGRTPLHGLRNAALLLVGGVLLAVGGTVAGNAVNAAIGGPLEGIDGEVIVTDVAPKGGAPELVPGESVDLTGTECEVDAGLVICTPRTDAPAATAGEDAPDPIASSPGGASSIDALEPDLLEALSISSDGFDGYRARVDEQGGLAFAWDHALGVDAHSGGTFETLASGGFALAVLGACLLVARPLRPLLIPIAAVGSMPLTAYSLHIASFALLVWPYALVPGIELWPVDAGGNGLWLASIGALLVVCTAWALLVGKGPLERLTARAALAIDGAAPRSGRGTGSREG